MRVINKLEYLYIVSDELPEFYNEYYDKDGNWKIDYDGRDEELFGCLPKELQDLISTAELFTKNQDTFYYRLETYLESRLLYVDEELDDTDLEKGYQRIRYIVKDAETERFYEFMGYKSSCLSDSDFWYDLGYDEKCLQEVKPVSKVITVYEKI